MLERKRILRPTDARLDEASGRRVLFYEHVGTGDTFVVTDPGLHLDQLEEGATRGGGFAQNFRPTSDGTCSRSTHGLTQGLFRAKFLRSIFCAPDFCILPPDL